MRSTRLLLLPIVSWAAAACSSDNLAATIDAAVDAKSAADAPANTPDAPVTIDAPVTTPDARPDAPPPIDARPPADSPPPPIDAVPPVDSPPGTPDAAAVVSTGFLIDSLTLLDPHIYYNLGLCIDVTSTADSMVNNAITQDQNNDGYRDLSILITMSPLNQGATATTAASVMYAQCTCPGGMVQCPTDTSCGPGQPRVDGTVTNQPSGTCLGALPGTTTAPTLSNGYTGIPDTTGPCFLSSVVSLTVNFGGAPITLEDAQAAGVYVGDPANGISNGLIRGFLPQSSADNIMLMGMPLSSFLPGGMGCCADHSDLDTGPNNEPGWYMYLQYTAHQVPYSGD
jgi:hypothetical protein